MKPMTPRQTGFTLIELSIVLVIIGLIVGGILTGRDLIRASELRSLMKDYQRYQTTLNTFRTKYNCLPGDCPNATDFFGTDNGGCPSGTGKTGTCNGDGNGLLDDAAGREKYRAWQQLALAGLISGAYVGADWFNANPGVNVPAASFQNAGFVFYQCDVASCYGKLGNALLAGKAYSNSLESGFLTGAEAAQVDSKLDDGIANTGAMIGLRGHGALGQTHCLSGSYQYIQDSLQRDCRLGLVF